MAKYNWGGITKEDVERAIEQFLANNPEYPMPRSTYLIYQDKKLPAKHIRGMAYEVAYNESISKDAFSGGMETARFFERLGFVVSHQDKEIRAKKEGKITARKKTTCKTPKEKTKDKKVKENKIKISAKAVIEQKNALQLILNRMFDGDIVCEKTYPWLRTPSEITEEYVSLCKALKDYRGNDNFEKKNYELRCDFVCEGKKLIIEYDERQHFTGARKVALEAYQDVSVCFDRDLWIKACEDVNAHDRQPANRDEVRAYYDATRDIQAYKNGYHLVRIMHGQIDFTEKDAAEKLKDYLSQVMYKPRLSLKVAMYLQTDEKKKEAEFEEAMEEIKKTDADIVVFPEYCYTPFVRELINSDIENKKCRNQMYALCLEFSRQMGRAVVISSCHKPNTKDETIYSIYANAYALEDDTKTAFYVKHTMTGRSAFDADNYSKLAKTMFPVIHYRGYKLGMTICYDCNHAIFSRMYGLQDVDLIINSTGGNVVYDKWHKYNQTRAIENDCYVLVTMGGNGDKSKPNSYVFGFNPKGKDLMPKLLNSKSKATNIDGGIYLYDLSKDRCDERAERSISQKPSVNKYQHLRIPVGDVDSILNQSRKLEEGLFVYKYKDTNVIFVITEDEEIFHAEKFLPKMYRSKLKHYANRRYVLVNKYKNLDVSRFQNQLSVVLKVRAMENFCAVILESDISNSCYQTGKSKTSQVVKSENGMFGLDLGRMTGPEAIWKNKGKTFKVSWRKNYEWLVKYAAKIGAKKQD